MTMNKLKQRLAELTWNDLREIAGSKILNRGKSYIGRVNELSVLDDNLLVAWVMGSRKYATTVEIDENSDLGWFCTCPFDWGGPCKHVIAVVLAAIEEIKENRTIRPLDPDKSDLYQVIVEETDNFLDDEEEDTFDRESQPAQSLEDILQTMPREELIDLILEANKRFPEIGMRITHANQLKQGDVRQIARSLRHEILDVTSEEAWYNPWRDEGSLPDYSTIQEQLEMLTKAHQYDTVLELGELLWKKGNEQVATSNDEGETAMAIAECMDIVFRAIPHGSLAREEQLFRLINFSIEDEFSIAEGCREILEDNSYTPEYWEKTATILEQQLKKTPSPGGDDYSLRYRRKKIVDWLIRAWEHSGQQEKIIPLLEKEASRIHCYERLVNTLLAEDRKEDARKWCIRGIKKTKTTWAGIASTLQKKLRTMAEQEDRLDMVAAYRAEDFFLHPSLETYLALQKTAKALGNWPLVRSMAMEFLEKGNRPDGKGKKKWPFPAPEARTGQPPVRREHFPQYGTLIDIALHEKRFDDAISLYNLQKKARTWGSTRDRQIAEAVAATHPDVSLAIWEKLARAEIARVKPAAYEVAATYLAKMRTLYNATNRLDEWSRLIDSIRREHKRKRRLLEVLDALENKKILSGTP